MRALMTRVRPTYVLHERELLDGWLEFHRATLLVKCEGLDDVQRKARPIDTSELSLHGLVRHMAETETGFNVSCDEIKQFPKSGLILK
jgi:hypothetical protein